MAKDTHFEVRLKMCFQQAGVSSCTGMPNSVPFEKTAFTLLYFSFNR